MGGSQHPALAQWHGCVSPGPAGALPCVTSPPSPQDALIDSIKKSKLHFVHCFLPKAAGGGGDPRGLPCRRVSGSELELPAEHCEAAGLMQLDVPLLRAQLRGSRLLDALRMYRQGEPPPVQNSCPILPPTGVAGGEQIPRLQRGAPRGTPLARVLVQSPAAASFSRPRGAGPAPPAGLLSHRGSVPGTGMALLGCLRRCCPAAGSDPAGSRP